MPWYMRYHIKVAPIQSLVPPLEIDKTQNLGNFNSALTSPMSPRHYKKVCILKLNLRFIYGGFLILYVANKPKYIFYFLCLNVIQSLLQTFHL